MHVLLVVRVGVIPPRHIAPARAPTPAAAERTERSAQADTFKAFALERLGKQHLAPATAREGRMEFNGLLFAFIGRAGRPDSS